MATPQSSPRTSESQRPVRWADRMRAWGRRFWDSPTVRGFTGRFPPISKSDRRSGLDARKADRTGRPRDITGSPQPTLDGAKAAEFKHPNDLAWPSKYVEMVEENRVRPPSDAVSDLSEERNHDEASHRSRDDSTIDAGDVLSSTLDNANIFPDFATEYGGFIPGDGYAHIGELSSDGPSAGGDIPSGGSPVGGDVTLEQQLAELTERGISLNELPHDERKRLADLITREVDEIKRFAVRDEVADSEISDKNDIASPRPQYPMSDLVPLVPRDDLLTDPRVGWDYGLRAAPIPIADFERQACQQELAPQQEPANEQEPAWETFARRYAFADEQGYNPEPSPPPYNPTPGAVGFHDLLARRDEIRRILEGGRGLQEGLARQRNDRRAGDVVSSIPEERASDSASLSPLPSDRDAESRDARRTAIQHDLEEQYNQNNENNRERE